MDKIPMTINGYENLQAEIKRLKTNERPQIIAAIAEARKHGDLSENAEYHAAKEQQAMNEAKISDLEDKLSRADVIDITKLSDTTDVKVILTFDCDTATIRHELYGVVRDGIPDHFNIKEEVIVNFHKDKRIVIIVEASPVCNPEISVFYE